MGERMSRDLQELYNEGATPGIIKGAFGLNGLIPAKLGQTSFATKALPEYYTGNRKAKTVMVMLNLGRDIDEANSDLMSDIAKSSMVNAGDIVGYYKWRANVGRIDKWRLDNFYLKQAFFFKEWKNTANSVTMSSCKHK